MYEAFYKLKEKPFSIMPDPDLIYWGRAHRLAFSMLEFGVMNNAQFTVITGIRWFRENHAGPTSC